MVACFEYRPKLTPAIELPGKAIVVINKLRESARPGSADDEPAVQSRRGRCTSAARGFDPRTQSVIQPRTTGLRL